MRRIVVLVALIVAAAGIVPACRDSARAAATQIPAGYVNRTNAETAVVFVHGVFGDATSTWSNATSGSSWPILMASDTVFANADVYVHSFRSPYATEAMSIDELVEDARVAFNHDEIFAAHRRIYFICHSMGGLVVRGLLRRYRDFAKQVPAILFLATPTEGSGLARAARTLSGNPHLASMADRGRGDAYLNVLRRDWVAAQFSITSRCLYETRDTFGQRVVSEESASALCNGPVQPFNGNHIEIAKPAARTDRTYTAFVDLFHAAELSPHETVASTMRSAGVPVPRDVTVPCGSTVEGTVELALPPNVPPGRAVTDVGASIAFAKNLKTHTTWLVDHDARTARVGYRLAGVDANAQGKCEAAGKAVLVATFFVEADGSDGNRVGQYIEQRTAGDNSPAVANVSGNVTIIMDPDGTGARAPREDPTGPEKPQSSRGGRGAQGSVNQSTEGTNSPAIAGVGGNVSIQKPKSRERKIR